MPGKKGGRTSNVRTPEELETLFEDALMIRDREMLVEMFWEGAVLVRGSECLAHGSAEIVRLALATWHGDHTYVADPKQIIQARDIALIVTERGINVAYRRESAWQYVIVCQWTQDQCGGSK